MLRRNLLLGGLIAGAFLLPSVASAGVVAGKCVNCHTMHNSQNGVNVNATLNDALLGAGSTCVGCHAKAGSENTASGTPGVGLAPQVDNDGASGYILNGGYFSADSAANDPTHHNVADLATVDANFVGKNIPGSSPSIAVVGADGDNAALGCKSCHSNAGHHKSTGGTYRMLPGVTAGADPNTGYGAADAATSTVGTRGDVNYASAEMDLFCEGCHGTFHTAQAGSVAGTWYRHPTDVSLNVEAGKGTAPSINTAFTSTDAVPMGTDAAVNGATKDVVMCLSCHVPHGGPYNDLLAFPYDATNNVAGSGGASVGCESCHSYSGTGM